MPAAPSPPPFAKDDSKNPPATSLLDRLTRSFSRAAYLVIILGIYAVAATALGLALAPALWWFDRIANLSETLPAVLHWISLGTGAASCFFVFGFVLLLVVPLYNIVLPTRVRRSRAATTRFAPHHGCCTMRCSISSASPFFPSSR